MRSWLCGRTRHLEKLGDVELGSQRPSESRRRAGDPLSATPSYPALRGGVDATAAGPLGSCVGWAGCPHCICLFGSLDQGGRPGPSRPTASAPLRHISIHFRSTETFNLFLSTAKPFRFPNLTLYLSCYLASQSLPHTLLTRCVKGETGAAFCLFAGCDSEAVCSP